MKDKEELELRSAADKSLIAWQMAVAAAAEANTAVYAAWEAVIEARLAAETHPRQPPE